jgi:hypothetical protein
MPPGNCIYGGMDSMKNITHLFQKYRECVRNLWNTYFFIDEKLSSYLEDVLDRFAEIDKQLFATLSR